MKTVQISVEDEILDRAVSTAATLHCSVEDLLRQFLDKLGAKPKDDLILGLMKDEPALMDQVVEWAMEARGHR